jgi:hypothetical protein
MQKRSDLFPLIVLFVTSLLAFIFHSFYADLVKAAVIQFFSELFGLQAGEVAARLTEMAIPIAVAGAVVWLLYRYLRQQLALPLEARYNFQVGPNIHCTSQKLVDEKGQQTDFYRNTYFLPVGNGLDEGKTLKRVQARIFNFGEPVLTRIKGQKDGTADIRHGEWIFVQIGSIVSRNVYGRYEGSETVSGDWMTNYSHNTSQGYFSFEVDHFDGKRAYGLSYDERMKPVWKPLLVISADDVLSYQAFISVDMSDLKSPIKAVEPLRS